MPSADLTTSNTTRHMHRLAHGNFSQSKSRSKAFMLDTYSMLKF